MKEILSKEIADELMKIKGETRGLAIKDDFDYILQKKGEGIEALEEELANLGYPIKYEEIKPTHYYPSGLEPIIMLATKKIFNFTREEFKDLGEFSAKIPTIVRLFMKYFGSLEIAAKAAPVMWRKYYSEGDLKVVDLNKEKKQTIIRIENFGLHPLHCIGLEGYFVGIVKMVVNKPTRCEETKCSFRGDDYHEFLVRW